MELYIIFMKSPEGIMVTIATMVTMHTNTMLISIYIMHTNIKMRIKVKHNLALIGYFLIIFIQSCSIVTGKRMDTKKSWFDKKIL